MSCNKVDVLSDKQPLNDYEQNLPPNFPKVPVPSDNPITTAKVELGRHLFYDERLSKDFSTSCASCHQISRAFADGSPMSSGFGGLMTTRNSIALTNVAYNPTLFWEGGVFSLEIQALAPIVAPNEFNMRTDSLVRRINQIEKYRALFRNAWGDETITLERVTKSIATFQRTLISTNSPFDKWYRGDRSALSVSAQRGLELFFGETGDCFHCHGGYNYTDNGFNNNGLDSVIVDEGRYLITGLEQDKGKFKTPTLRNIALSAPYMHDGRFQTLEQVIRHYNSGGKPHPNADILMRPLGLSETDIQDLVEFLKSLTDTEFINNPALQRPAN